MEKPTLEVTDLTTHFCTRRGVVPGVRGVSFKTFPGQITGLVGESGCGKSVTALSIMGLVPSSGRVVQGKILLEGENLLQKTSKEMRRLRGERISMIFQEPMTSLNPVYPIGKQVGEVLKLHSTMGRRERREKVIEMLHKAGVPEASSRYRAFPHQLSGGLRQRVMIAMALICKPKLLIADEPTTALDVTIQAQILALMADLLGEMQTSILLITHDLGVVAEVCHHVNVMYAGKVVESASVWELFENPLHPYTLGLLHSIPHFKARQKHARLHAIRGSVPDLLHLPQGCAFAPRCNRATSQCLKISPSLETLGKDHACRCWHPETETRSLS